MKISSLPNITITTIIITTGAGITIIITTIATDRRDLFASYNQMKKGSAPALPFFLRALLNLTCFFLCRAMKMPIGAVEDGFR